jgi:hypothetical protein
MGAGAAGAAETNHHQRNTCTGTLASPGVLAGVYRGNVVVTGVCFVDGGAAVIKGNLILAPGSTLNATYSASPLTVFGNVSAGSGAVMAMGCEPNELPCSDNQNAIGTATFSVTSWRCRR